MTNTVDGEVQSTALVTLNPEEYVKTAYSPFVDQLALAKKADKKVTYDIQTKEGMAVAKAQRKIFSSIRIAIGKKRTEVKAPILEITRLLDGRCKLIEDEARAEEDKHDAAITAETERLEAIEAAEIRAKEERKAAITQAINEIIEAPSSAISLNADETLALLEKIKNTVINNETFGDRDVEAENAQFKAIQTLTQMHTDKVAQAIAAQAEKERQEREGAERAEQARIDGIKARLAVMEKAVVNAAMADTSAEVQGLIDQVSAIVIDSSFAEFMAEATDTQSRALKGLRRSLNALLDEEEEAAANLAAQTPVAEAPAEEVAPVVEEQPAANESVTSQANNVQNFAGATRRRPTRLEIIEVVASAFNTRNDIAEKLLVEEFQMAKAA